MTIISNRPLNTFTSSSNFRVLQELTNDYKFLAMVDSGGEGYEVTDELISQYIAESGPFDAILSSFFAKLDSRHIIICFPEALYKTTRPVAVTLTPDLAPSVQTDYCFNFSVNRKRVNRFLMMKIIEWFGLSNMNYTWSGADFNFDLSVIIQEMKSIKSPVWADDFQSFVLAPIAIEKKWIKVQGDTAVEATHIRPVDNQSAWHAGLDQLYSTSAVSLISESIDYQAGAGYTEKTSFAVFGRTFPLWVGGKYQAEQFAKLGYDTFDDVIDHSYQYRDTLIERCYHAIADNLRILTDLEHAAVLRNSMLERLTVNRQKLLTDCLNPAESAAKLQKFIKDPSRPGYREQLSRDFASFLRN
jgi:hypothetical protein